MSQTVRSLTDHQDFRSGRKAIRYVVGRTLIHTIRVNRATALGLIERHLGRWGWAAMALSITDFDAAGELVDIPEET